MPKSSLDERRTRLVKIGSALPEASAEQTGRMGEHTTFRVRKKTYAYLLVNHHGDGRVALCCKVAPGEQQALIASDPARFFRPAYLGASGWVGVDLDGGKIDWAEIAGLMTESYLLLAPKTLAAQVR